MALLLAIALTGTLLQHCGAPSGAAAHPPTSTSRIFGQYLPMLVVNWGLVLYCCRLFRGRNALTELLGERWRTARGALADLAFACGCFFVIMSVELVSARLFAVGQSASITELLPSTGAERLTWVLVAVSAGFCEEVVYRGYLQTQLAAFTGKRILGVALQAALFGLAHLEQGPAAALRAAVYGLLLGTLASFRRGLFPSIACHIGIDLASGLLR